MTKVIYTIGHSTYAIDEFVKMLEAHNVEVVVDVRTIPKSRHNPQFNEGELRANLLKHGIGYIHLKELGGCGIQQKHQSIPPGETRRSVVTRIICRVQSLRTA
jgi:uncharacterized protein (DUF488 family)